MHVKVPASMGLSVTNSIEPDGLKGQNQRFSLSSNISHEGSILFKIIMSNLMCQMFTSWLSSTCTWIVALLHSVHSPLPRWPSEKLSLRFVSGFIKGYPVGDSGIVCSGSMIILWHLLQTICWALWQIVFQWIPARTLQFRPFGKSYHCSHFASTQSCNSKFRATITCTCQGQKYWPWQFPDMAKETCHNRVFCFIYCSACYVAKKKTPSTKAWKSEPREYHVTKICKGAKEKDNSTLNIC